MRVSLPLAVHHPRFAAAVRRADRALRRLAFALLLTAAIAAAANHLGVAC